MDSSKLSIKNSVLGTLAYASPEQHDYYFKKIDKDFHNNERKFLNNVLG
jgi:hypothetical protein